MQKNMPIERQRRENLTEMQNKKHPSYIGECREELLLYALHTVGADADTGSGESSSKRKYKTAVVQEWLEASW